MKKIILIVMIVLCLGTIVQADHGTGREGAEPEVRTGRSPQGIGPPQDVMRPLDTQALAAGVVVIGTNVRPGAGNHYVAVRDMRAGEFLDPLEQGLPLPRDVKRGEIITTSAFADHGNLQEISTPTYRTVQDNLSNPADASPRGLPQLILLGYCPIGPWHLEPL